MIELPTMQTCPNCGSSEEPKLLIRGSGMTGHGWVLRCRTCDRDWSDGLTDRPRAS